MQNQSIATKLKNAPLWWHLLFLAFLLGFSRTLLAGSLTLGSLIVGAILVFLIGPVWLIPIPGQRSWILDLAITILLVLAYYSALIIVKRGDHYRGMLVYSRKWLRLLKVYVVINLVSACIAVPLSFRQMKSEEVLAGGEESAKQQDEGLRREQTSVDAAPPPDLSRFRLLTDESRNDDLTLFQEGKSTSLSISPNPLTAKSGDRRR